MPYSCLITGGAGFFGSILKQELLKQGMHCVSIDIEPDDFKHENHSSIQGDIRDKKLLDKIFSKNKFDVIFHCAALLAHVNKDFKNLWSSNVVGTENIANMAQKYNVGKIIFISSNCLWGKNFDKLVSEEETPEPIEIYGKSKLEAEKILLSHKEFNSVIFRSPTIMDEGRLGLLGILFEFVEENRKLWMVGGGENKYQFIYAKDLSNACIKAIDYDKTDIFNIGSLNVKSFNEVYKYLIEKADSKSKLVHLPKKLLTWCMQVAYLLNLSPLGPYQYKMISSNFVFDISKIQDKLNFTPTLTNEEMLFRAYTYYKNNKAEISQRKNVSAHKQIADMGIIKLVKWLS